MDDRKVSRRAVLKSGLLIGLGLCTAARAQQKASKQSVSYQDKPSGSMKCADCENFIAPGSCRIVEGAISPNGYCVEWTKKG